MRTWRVVLDRRRDDAFTGHLAAEFGARWNAEWLPAVYLASHPSLAVLEIVANATRSRLGEPFVAIPVDVPDVLDRQVIDAAGLPQGWQQPESSVCRELGSAWIRAGTTALLDVPSAVLPLERNVIANPAHPDFKRLDTSHPGYPLRFDERVLALVEQH